MTTGKKETPPASTPTDKGQSAQEPNPKTQQKDEKIKGPLVSVFPLIKGAKFNVNRFFTVDWNELVKMVSKPLYMPDNKPETKVDNGQYWVRGIIKATGQAGNYHIGHKKDANLDDGRVVVLDVDKEIEGKPLPTVDEVHKALTGIKHLVYSSATPGRCRIVAPTSSQYGFDIVEAVTVQFYELCRSRGLNFALSNESITYSQSWFYGQTIKGNKLEVQVGKGKLFQYDVVKAQAYKKQSVKQTKTLEELASLDEKRNWPKWIIQQIESGTIHDCAKRYAAWKHFDSRTMTANQIFDEITAMVDTYCPDPKKVKRWHDGERADLEKWFSQNKPKDEELPPMVGSVPKDEFLDLSGLTKGNGFLDTMVDYLCNYGRHQHREASLLSSCCLLGTICHRFVIKKFCRPVIFGVHIGASGSGKTTGPIDGTINLIHGTDAYRYHREFNYSSEAAFLNGLKNQPVQFLTRDEIGEYLQDINDITGYKRTVADLMLRGFGTHRGFRRDVADPTACFTLQYHFFNIYGTTTPERLYKALKGENIDMGLLPRFLIFHPDPKAVTLNKMKRIKTAKTADYICQALRDLMSRILVESGILDLDQGKKTKPNEDIQIDLTDKAFKYYELYANQCDTIVAAGRVDGVFVARRAEYALKLAFIRQLCLNIIRHERDIKNKKNPVCSMLPKKIGLDSMRWGVEMMERYGKWVQRHLFEQIHEGEEGEVAGKIIKYLRRQFEAGEKTVAWRDISKSVRASSARIKRDAVEALVEEGRVVKIESRSNRGGHRFYLAADG